MEITGGGSVIELGPEMEVLQPAEEHPMWQDSVVLCWWDLDNHVGGYHRIGHHAYHPEGPLVHLTSNFFGADCVLRRCGFIPLRPEDQGASTYGCGDGTCGFEFTDHAIWTFDQPEVSGELHVHDFHPPVDIYPKTGQLAERITAGHLEVGGGVTGSLTLNGTTYEIDGLGFRDHGWGKRYWEDFVAHRWLAGTFGPEMTVLAVAVLGTDDTIAEFGCVIREGTLTYADTVDMVTYLEHDALTHRGGRTRMELPGGETLVIDIEPLQRGAVSQMPGSLAVTDTMSRITCDGRVGICNYEISNNASRGRHFPRFAINGVSEDGLHVF
jgi:hypothetical protein